MVAYILIVVVLGCGGSNCGTAYPIVTMQRFDNAKACQFASVELNKINERPDRLRAVCVPESIK